MWKKVCCYETLSKRFYLKSGYPFHTSLVGAEVQGVLINGPMSIYDSNLWRNYCDIYIPASFVPPFESYVNKQA